jgi:hypothetical protein
MSHESTVVVKYTTMAQRTECNEQKFDCPSRMYAKGRIRLKWRSCTPQIVPRGSAAGGVDGPNQEACNDSRLKYDYVQPRRE